SGSGKSAPVEVRKFSTAVNTRAAKPVRRGAVSDSEGVRHPAGVRHLCKCPAPPCHKPVSDSEGVRHPAGVRHLCRCPAPPCHKPVSDSEDTVLAVKWLTRNRCDMGCGF